MSTAPARFGALRYPAFRLFALGQSVSNIGFWIQSQALQWLVFAVLTRDPQKLGIASFLQQFPILVFGILAGAVADSMDRRRLLIITQAMMMLQAAVLAWLTLSSGEGGRPAIQMWHVFALSTVYGLITAFDLPARQAFLLDLVPKPHLQNAVAINSLLFNAARIIGPAVAGLLIARIYARWPTHLGLGEGICFLLNAATFMAALAALLAIRTRDTSPSNDSAPGEPPAQNETTADKGLPYLLEGLRYVARQPHLAALLVFVGIITIFALPYLMLITVYAKDVLRGDASAFGVMMSSVGVGAILGGTYMATRTSIRGVAGLMGLATIGFALMIAALAITRGAGGLRVASALIGFAGFFMVIAMIGNQMLIQTLVTEQLRGRVLSLFTMVNVGLMAFGNLLAGIVAKRLGVCATLGLMAGICIITVALFATRLPALRRSARATPEYQEAVAA